MSLARTRVRARQWDRGSRTEQPGAQITAGTHSLFIAGPELRTVADALHDIADRIEEVAR